ncbi:GNAT family N-acetyltransferase [Chloroflexota bacterium]
MTQGKPYKNLTFKPLATTDIPLIYKWFNTPHVNKWWSINGYVNPSLHAVSDKYVKRINFEESVFCHIVYFDNNPVAYIQWYRVSDFEESIALVPDSNNKAGIDIFIGESDYLYRGLGPVIIKRYISEVIFEESDIQGCIIDPEPKNKAAIRAYEKAGFKYKYTKRNQHSDVDAYIMELQKD